MRSLLPPYGKYQEPSQSSVWWIYGPAPYIHPGRLRKAMLHPTVRFFIRFYLWTLLDLVIGAGILLGALWRWGLLAVVILAGCTVPVTSTPVGGSRMHGTVTVAYTYGPFEIPEVDEAAMQEQADRRCVNWGYLNAHRFGGQSQHCAQMDANGICWMYQVNIQYQCQTLHPPTGVWR